MSKFALQQLDDITGYIPIYKLLINGRCQFDDFCKSISSNMLKELDSTFAILNDLSNDRPLSSNKFKQLANCGQYKDYETRKESLRVYMVKLVHMKGYLIILGSKNKDSFKKDISKMRIIKTEYFSSI